MKKVFCLSACVIILTFVFTLPVFAKTSCTILTKNLSYGSTNSSSGSQVTSLQNFLYSAGYLSTPATGRYGDLTVASVKKFQTAKGISAIGTVGPQTRVAIQKVSCPISTVNSALTTSVAEVLCPNGNTLTSSCAVAPGGVTTVPIPVSTPTPENNPIFSPTTGSRLTIGQKYLIQWTGGNSQSIISVLLKDQNGAGAGWVSDSLSGTTNSYNWTVGNVSIAGQQPAVVPPGNYQLNVIDNASYGSALTLKSRIFSIAEAPLYIAHVLPTSVPADGKTTVILYGSGFSNLTKVVLAGSGYYNPVIVPRFVSADSSFLWFFVPQYVTSGQYQVSVYNDYSSADSSNALATSTPSNQVNLQVNQAVQ